MKYLYIGGKKVFVDEEVYKIYRRSKRREKYLEKTDKAYSVVSLDDLPHDVSNGVSAEDDFLRTKEKKALHVALDKLTDEEFDLIDRIYFGGETLADIARERNVDYKKLWRAREKILKKLREMLGDLD